MTHLMHLSGATHRNPIQVAARCDWQRHQYNLQTQSSGRHTFTFSESESTDFGDAEIAEIDVDTAVGEQDPTDILRVGFRCRFVHRLIRNSIHHRQHESGYLQHRVYSTFAKLNCR